MEKLEERYLRWVLKMDKRTPGYLVREELQKEKLKEREGGHEDLRKGLRNRKEMS